MAYYKQIQAFLYSILWKFIILNQEKINIPQLFKATMIQSFASNSRTSHKQIPISGKAVLDSQSLLSIIDKSLRHLNHISVFSKLTIFKQSNVTAQQLYIQLLKEKKTMKFDQIKKIYRTLTEGKAKQILFERDKKQLIETDYQNHYFRGLIRLCWRSIQKLIKKITYYMINESNLSIISKSVLKLIHLNQSFVRRFQKLKNSSMLFIIQIIQKLIEENSILEKKIYDILLNRGYVVSLDEFYKLNGCDAQHRQAYYAKKQDALSSDDQEQVQNNIVKPQTKSDDKNSKKQTVRKKKGFRVDCRYSWKQKLQFDEKQQDKQKFPANKTNFQIRQSFEKFIGDFLQNQNLNDILLSYKFQDESKSKQSDQQKVSKKIGQRFSPDSLIQKKIFQSKIQSVINQLKSHNVKISSKLLQIIDNSSNQVINSKANNIIEKKIVQRKNSQRRQSGNLLAVQRKLRQSSIINDRKIVNQNFFRQLLRRNTNMQNYINDQLLIDAEIIKKEIQAIHNQKPASNIIQFSKSVQYHNGNHSKQLSKFAKPTQGNAVFFFNNKDGKQNYNQPNLLKSVKKINKTQRFLETQLNCKYKINQNPNSEFKSQSVTQKIRIVKQQWDLINQRTILQAIQNADIQPGNPSKFAETLQALNKKRNLEFRPVFVQQGLIMSDINQKCQNKNKIKRFQTQISQTEKQANIKNLQNNFSSAKAQAFVQRTQQNRIKTEQYSSRRTQKLQTKKKTVNFLSNKMFYEVYDTRLRRFVKRY